MEDYKAAKEAFVSDNPGASIISVNNVSFMALASYALWITTAPHLHKPGFVLNYIVCVVPVLLGVTVFATSPFTYTSVLAAISLIAYSKSVYMAKEAASYPVNSQNKKSVGRWLDESDSDEEPAEPASAGVSTTVSPVKLPSQVAFSSGPLLSPQSANASPGSDSPTSSNNFGMTDDPLGVMGVSKRRSPQPLSTEVFATPSIGTVKDRSSPIPTLRLRKPPRPKPKMQARAEEVKGRLPFLTVYRAHMMLMTVICILAVDFEVFPRWQGKCEDFGTSLMDVGVGSFVFSLGLVSTKTLSPPPPSPPPTSPALSTHFAISQPSPIKFVVSSLRKSIPVLILGCIRLVMVKGSDYPEHVSEYGVHWNFFFTLAIVPVLAVCVRPLTQYLRWSSLGILISLAHQFFLHHFQHLILSTSRPNLLMANKEGISSLPGYLSIFLLGLSTGDHIRRLALPSRGRKVVLTSEDEREEREERHLERKMVELGMELIGYGVGWWVALGVWRWAGGEVSRRLANTPYVLWIAAYNTSFLFGYLVISYLLSFSSSPPPSSSSSTPPPSITSSISLPLRSGTSSSSSSVQLVPPLLEAMNQNGLVVFLIANLLTGLVNVSMETMYVGTWTSVLVLSVYAAGVAGAGWVLRGRKVGGI